MTVEASAEDGGAPVEYCEDAGGGTMITAEDEAAGYVEAGGTTLDAG